MIQYDFTEFLAYNDKADSQNVKDLLFVLTLKKSVPDIQVKHLLAQPATEACWSMAKINRAKNTYKTEPSWLVFFICIAGAFDKSSLKDGEGGTETKNL